jgi:hypothetical protein
VIGLVPTAKPEKFIVDKTPLPLTPETGPSNVSAVRVIVPAALLIFPGIKKFLPRQTIKSLR